MEVKDLLEAIRVMRENHEDIKDSVPIYHRKNEVLRHIKEVQIEERRSGTVRADESKPAENYEEYTMLFIVCGDGSDGSYSLKGFTEFLKRMVDDAKVYYRFKDYDEMKPVQFFGKTATSWCNDSGEYNTTTYIHTEG